jgi:CBS domain-containing protein
MRRIEFPSERREFRQLTAAILMERDVVTCGPSDTARHVAAELTASNFGLLPVVRERGVLVGLVSEFDLLKVLMEGRDLDAVRAEEIMTRQITTVQEDTPVDELIRLLEREHLIRVPVVLDGKLMGIVARRDILYGYLKTTAQNWP